MNTDSNAAAIPASTVRQPWAWAIFHGKTIENRTQNVRYRGPLAIHTGRTLRPRGMVLGNPIALPMPYPCRGALGLWQTPTDLLDRFPEGTDLR